MPTIENTMTRLPMNDLAARVGRLLRRWKTNTEGVAAVEFAMVVPIMAIMFIGAVELSQAITVDRRVTQVASSTADLVARWSSPSGSGSTNGIPQSEITDVMRVGGIIVSPYDKNPLQIIIRSVMSSPTDANNTKQWWSCTFNGLGSTLVCACSNTSYTLPPNLVTTLDNVVISETTYSYKPLVFDHFMKRLGTSGTSGTYTLGETIYLKPRNGQVNMQQSNNTPCPTPTF
jgi:Flp pilus assembly pilin Flp